MFIVTSDIESLLLAYFPPLYLLRCRISTTMCHINRLFSFLKLSFKGSYMYSVYGYLVVHDYQIFCLCLWLVFHSLDGLSEKSYHVANLFIATSM